MGAAAEPPNVAASMAPADSAVPRPGHPDHDARPVARRSGSSAPSSSAAAVARTCAPAIDAARSRPVAVGGKQALGVVEVDGRAAWRSRSRLAS